jgi:hypothetical protein
VLTTQTAAAGSLLSGADLKQAPIAPLIAPLPGDATVAPRPDVLVVYGLYLFMFLAAVLLSYLAFRRYRRPKAGPDDPSGPEPLPPPTGEDTASAEDADDAAAEHRRVATPVRA